MLRNTRVFIYASKCIIGVAIGYLLCIAFPVRQFIWAIISTVLVISPEEHQSNKLALERIWANIIGSLTGLLIFLVYKPNLLSLSVGVVAVIATCSFLKLINSARIALSALVIVTIFQSQQGTWQVALERMVCVIIGCIIAIVVTTICNKLGSYLSS